ncbi:hypothetical protein LZ32DRAFT_29003 [Colletotrichum eremochloae]|nr:hypothetical protein LZ32DRAFT_29003 [Colletotrichum eremochloae]
MAPRLDPLRRSAWIAPSSSSKDEKGEGWKGENDSSKSPSHPLEREQDFGGLRPTQALLASSKNFFLLIPSYACSVIPWFLLLFHYAAYWTPKKKKKTCHTKMPKCVGSAQMVAPREPKRGIGLERPLFRDTRALGNGRYLVGAKNAGSWTDEGRRNQQNSPSSSTCAASATDRKR